MIELTHEQASVMKIANTHDVRPGLMEEFDVPQQLFQYMTTAVKQALGRDPSVYLTDAGSAALAAYDAKWCVIEAEVLHSVISVCKRTLAFHDKYSHHHESITEFRNAVARIEEVLGD